VNEEIRDVAWGAPVEDANVVDLPQADHDIDIYDWLSEQNADGVDTVTFDDGSKVKIAAIGEVEENKLLRAARRPDPQPGNPKNTKIDMLTYRRLYIAFSLTKANGKAVTAEQLENVLPGRLTRLQKEIQALSKYEREPAVARDPFDSIG